MNIGQLRKSQKGGDSAQNVEALISRIIKSFILGDVISVSIVFQCPAMGLGETLARLLK